jgi:hypothetical protein
VLVELAIVTPVLILFLAATFDFGLAWRDSITQANAARAGARVGSNLGKADLADHSMLVAISAAMADIPLSTVDRVIVFKSTTADGKPSATCLSNATKSVGGATNCNVYDSTDLANVAANPTGTQSSFTGSCTGSRLDRFWCPTNRLNNQGAAAGMDYVGVFIKVNHDWVTKLMGTSIEMDDVSVMRIEPNAGN